MLLIHPLILDRSFHFNCKKRRFFERLITSVIYIVKSFINFYTQYTVFTMLTFWLDHICTPPQSINIYTDLCNKHCASQSCAPVKNTSLPSN